MIKEEFLKRAKEAHGDKYDYSLVQNEFAVTDKIKIICSEHGEFFQSSHSHTRSKKSGCPKCGLIKRAQSYSKPKTGESLLDKNPILCEEWSDKNELGPENYKYSSNKKVWWKCKKCNYEYQSIIGSRTKKHGSGCLECGGKKPRTLEKFIDESNIIHNNKYDYSHVKYINCFEKVEIICKIHGKFLQKPMVHINHQCGCPKCGTEKQIKSRSTPLNGEDLVTQYPMVAKDWSDKNNFKPENIFSKSSKKVYWECHKCKYEWKTAVCSRVINYIKYNKGCPYCSNKVVTEQNRLDKIKPDLIKEWSNKNNKKPSEYCFGTHQKVWWICEKCNHEWKASINNRVKRKGCPKCKRSHGEKEIENFLIQNNIKYKCEYRIEQCKNIKQLPFDFAIWINDKLKLIEYQGQQHYIKHPKWNSGHQSLENTQKRDKIKQDFCKNNNIPLLIIPYTEYNNIEQLVTNFLTEINYATM